MLFAQVTSLSPWRGNASTMGQSSHQPVSAIHRLGELVTSEQRPKEFLSKAQEAEEQPAKSQEPNIRDRWLKIAKGHRDWPSRPRLRPPFSKAWFVFWIPINEPIQIPNLESLGTARQTLQCEKLPRFLDAVFVRGSGEKFDRRNTAALHKINAHGQARLKSMGNIS